MIASGILAVVTAVLLSASGFAQMPQALSQVKITLSSGSILDGNVVYYQRESAEFLLEADASCYVFAFTVSPQGKVKLAFPYAGHPFNMVSPHQTVRVPDDGYSQSVGLKTGWAQFVVVASEDPSWAYSFNEYYAPKVWDSSALSGWLGAGSSSVVYSSDIDEAHYGAVSVQGMSSGMRSELRDEIASRSASRASASADLILARARAAVQGYRFAFSKQGFYVASNVYGFETGPIHDYDDERTYGGYSYHVYYDDLSPHGYWEFVAGFGYVWRPYHVSVSWAPYYRGRWVYTVHGWTWVSTEPWGWITYHYGYWTCTHRWGWVWIPGYTWAPARVTWYWSKGHVGWRPARLPPEIRVSFEVHIKEYPVTIVERDHFTAVKVENFAEVKRLEAKGDALLMTDGSRIDKLSDTSPQHQLRLAPGPVSALEVFSTSVEPDKGRTHGYYRVDKQRLYVPRPRLVPEGKRTPRLIPPRQQDKQKKRIDVFPRPKKPKPKRAKPKKAEPEKVKPKPKPKPKKATPPKEEPKKADPKKADEK